MGSPWVLRVAGIGSVVVCGTVERFPVGAKREEYWNDGMMEYGEGGVPEVVSRAEEGE